MFVASGCGTLNSPTDTINGDVVEDTTVVTDTPIVDDIPVVRDTEPEVVADIPVVTDVQPDVCVYNCVNKECGPDGCGGECGTCVNLECVEGECVPCTLPTTWATVAKVATASIPKELADYQAVCPDFSGDELGDDALAMVADIANPIFTEQLGWGWDGAVGEFVGVTDFFNAPPFTFNILEAGTHETGSTALDVHPMSYEDSACEARVSFKNAKIVDGVLIAGPQDMETTLTYMGMTVNLELKQVQVTGIVAKTDAGVTVSNGVLAGFVKKEIIDAVLVVMNNRCAELDPPTWCAQMETVEQFYPVMFDLDLNEDEEMDAASLCVKFTLDPATVVGYHEVD